MRRTRKTLTEIQMPSRFSESSRLRKVVCRLATAALQDPLAVADMELAVGEAFSNAIKYGEEDGKVCVKVETPTCSELSVELAYLGCKFDTLIKYPQDVLNAEGGFGRYIMQRTIDSMEYSFENGQTTLRMTKRRN